VKILYFALAANAFDHELHKASQVETWAKNINPESRVIWVYGDPSLAGGILVGNDLFLPVAEKYENILEKTILGIKWALDNLEFDYLIRTNTSNYFYDPLVRQHLRKISNSENTIGGVQAQWKGSIFGKRRLHNYISGAGIYMSRLNVGILAHMSSHEYRGIPDDVAIGHFLFSNRAKSKSIPRNDVTDFKPFWPMPQIRVKSWDEGEVTAFRMHEIHRIYWAESDESLKIHLKDFIDKEIIRVRVEKPRMAKFLQWEYKALKRILPLALKKARRLSSN
jgi:hypothetical protein